MRLIGFVVIVLGGTIAAVTSASGALGQTSARLPLIAILEVGSAATPSGGVAQFRQTLREFGWVEGRTVWIEARYGEWQPDRTTAMAKELVRLNPEVIYTH